MATAKKEKEVDNRVPVYLEYDKNNTEDVTVIVNGKAYLIKRGETVMVPPEVKEVVDNSRKQNIAAIKAMHGLQTDFENKARML